MSRRRGGAWLGAGPTLAQLFSEPGLVATAAIAVLLASLILTGTPRLLEVAASEDLRATATDPGPGQRNIRVEVTRQIPAGPAGDPMAMVANHGAQFARSQIPRSVADVISDRTFVVDSPRFGLSPLPGEEPSTPYPMFLKLRYQERIEDHLTLVEGVMPSLQEPVTALVGLGCPTEPDEVQRVTEQLAQGGTAEGCSLEEVPLVEVVLSSETARELGLTVGSRVVMEPDSTDPLYFGVPGEELGQVLVLSVSGIAELDDPSLEYWYGDPTLHRPAIQQNADLRIVRATGLISPEQYEPMGIALGTASWLYTWRHFVDSDLLARSGIETIRDDLAGFLQLHAPVAVLPENERAFSQLSDLIEDHLLQRRQSVDFMAMTAGGMVIVLTAGIMMLAVSITDRHRRSIILARNRGASPAQLSATRLYQALLLTVPATLLGFLIARWAVPGTDDTVPLLAAATLVVIATVLVVVSALPLSRRRLGALQREPTGRPGASPVWLWVLDGLFFVVAVGAVLTLRREAQGVERASAEGVDLLLAITPGLIGLAVGVLLSRLFPPLMAGLAGVSARRRDLVPYLGFRRSGGRDLAARLPIMVVVLCVATAAFAVILRSSIVLGQETQTWQAVGADFTVRRLGEGSVLPASLDPAGLPGVVDAAGATLYPRARIQTGSRTVDTRVLAVDLEAYHRMTQGTPGDPRLPETMLEDGGNGSGSLPAIVSADWQIEPDPTPGDVVSVDLGAIDPVLVIAEVRDHFPGLPAGEPFVVIDSEALERLAGVEVAPSVAYLKAPPASEQPIRDALAQESIEFEVSSRYQVRDDLLSDPLVEWAKTGLLLVIVFATILAVVTGVSSLSIGSTPRLRELGILRALGLDDRGSLRLNLLEQLPVLALATVTGALTGVLVAQWLSPALGIDRIVAGIVPVSVVIDWGLIAWMVLALVAAVTVAVVIFVGVDHRRAVTNALRMGGG